MKKIIFLIVVLSFFTTLISEIKLQGKAQEMAIYNKNSRKIYTYYFLEPGSEISLKVSGEEKLSIISRVVLTDQEKVKYDYNLIVGKESERIRKSAALSEVTRGIRGESVSAYNRTTVFLDSGTSVLKVQNISREILLLKFNTESSGQSSRSIDYVSYTPSVYGTEAILLLDDKSYTYYTLGNEGIQLTLEGPVVLKILSRYIFESTFINTNNYRFSVFNNDKLINQFTEQASKSSKALLKDDPIKIPSTGNVNIIKFEDGIHNIRIENGAINRELIFNLYISKSAIELGEE